MLCVAEEERQAENGNVLNLRCNVFFFNPEGFMCGNGKILPALHVAHMPTLLCQ